MARRYFRKDSSPTESDLHVSSPLTMLSLAAIQQDSNFVALQVFPPVTVDKLVDKVPIWTTNDWMRDEARPRIPPAEAQVANATVSTSTEFNLTRYDVADYVTERKRNSADAVWNLDAATVKRLTQIIKIRLGRLFSTEIFASSKWGATRTGNTTGYEYWSDGTGSNPKKQVDAEKSVILKATGQDPDQCTLMVGYDVHQALCNHPLIIDRYKYTAPDQLTPGMLADYFQIKRYLVDKSVYASNPENETAVPAYIMGKHALLVYVPDSPGLETMSGGYTFMNKDFGIGGIRVKPPYLVPEKEAYKYEVAADLQFKITSTSCGVLWSGIVA